MAGTRANPNLDGAGSSRGLRVRNVGDRAGQQGPVGTGVQVHLPNPPPLRPPPPQPPVYPQLQAYYPPSPLYHPQVPVYPPLPSVHYQPRLEYRAPPIHHYNYHHQYVPPVGHNRAPPEYVWPEVHYQGYHPPQMAYQYRAPVYPHPAYQAPYYHAYGHVPPVHHHGPNSQANAPIFNILNKSRISSYSTRTENGSCSKSLPLPKRQKLKQSQTSSIGSTECSISLPKVNYKGAVMQPSATQRSANPNSPLKKRPKIAKVVQSALCEACKVDSNSKDVLDKPKEGKKLIAASKPAPPPLPQVLAPDSTPDASATCNNTIIGPQENPSEGKSSGSKRGKSRAAETKDLETKEEKKMLKGGADAEAARWCDVCRVVCDNETVFRCHLSGRKHDFMESLEAIKMRRTANSGHLMIL